MSALDGQYVAAYVSCPRCGGDWDEINHTPLLLTDHYGREQTLVCRCQECGTEFSFRVQVRIEGRPKGQCATESKQRRRELVDV